jgi:hypothetical protein
VIGHADNRYPFGKPNASHRLDAVRVALPHFDLEFKDAKFNRFLFNELGCLRNSTHRQLPERQRTGSPAWLNPGIGVLFVPNSPLRNGSAREMPRMSLDSNEEHVTRPRHVVRR